MDAFSRPAYTAVDEVQTLKVSETFRVFRKLSAVRLFDQEQHFSGYSG